MKPMSVATDQSKKIKLLDEFQNAAMEEIDQEIIRIDSEMKKMQKFKEELLIIKRMRPQTDIYYSTKHLTKRTDTNNTSNVFKLQKINSDCLSLVLEFVFKHQVIEVGTLKELTLLCKAFWETIYFIPFTISLNKQVINISPKNMNKLVNLDGIELAWFPLNIQLMNHLVNLNGNKLENLVIRYDYHEVKVEIPPEFENSFKKLKYVDSLGPKKNLFEFTKMTTVENVCLILHSTTKTYHKRMLSCFPSNMKKLCILRSSIGQSLLFPDLVETEGLEHLTTIQPRCLHASDSIARLAFTDYYLPKSRIKTFTYIRIATTQKKPDPLEKLVVNHEIIAKNINGWYEVVASATYKTNVMLLAEIAHKHLEVEFEEDSAIPECPSQKYIDEHFKVFKKFLPDLVYSYDKKYSPHY